LAIGIPPSPRELTRSSSGSPLSPAAAAVLASAGLASPKPGGRRVSVWLPAGSRSFKSKSPRPSSPASETSPTAVGQVAFESDPGVVGSGLFPASASNGAQEVGQGSGFGQGGRVSLASTGEAAGEIEGVCAASWLHRMRSERQLSNMRKSLRRSMAAGRMSRMVSQKEREGMGALSDEEEEEEGSADGSGSTGQGGKDDVCG
jgi:hypothetical protein